MSGRPRPTTTSRGTHRLRSIAAGRLWHWPGTALVRPGTALVRHGTAPHAASDCSARSSRTPAARRHLGDKDAHVSGTARGARSTSSAARCASASTRLASRSSNARYSSIPRRHGHPTAARLLHGVVQLPSCGKFYHLECIKKLPLAKVHPASTIAVKHSKRARDTTCRERSRGVLRLTRRFPTRTSTRRCSRARRTRATAASKAATTCSTAGSATARTRTTRAAARR